jgi:hypothetical protein
MSIIRSYFDMSCKPVDITSTGARDLSRGAVSSGSGRLRWHLADAHTRLASIGSRTHLYGAFHSWYSWQSGSSRIEIPEVGTQEGTSSLEAINVSPRVGILFLLVPNVGLNGSLYVTRSWHTRKWSSQLVDEETESATDYGFTVGVSAFLR